MHSYVGYVPCVRKLAMNFQVLEVHCFQEFLKSEQQVSKSVLPRLKALVNSLHRDHQKLFFWVNDQSTESACKYLVRN